MPSKVLKYYVKNGLTQAAIDAVITKLKTLPTLRERDIKVYSELCYYVGLAKDIHLSEQDETKLAWILGKPLKVGSVTKESWLAQTDDVKFVIEIGPRLNFSTPFSTNAVSVCHSIGLDSIHRIEKSKRYGISFQSYEKFSMEEKSLIEHLLHDRMTECAYESPLESFDIEVKPTPVYEVDIIGRGSNALQEVNKSMGLSFDSWDIEFYTKLFTEKLNRNPTNVECFDLAQSNSEHSRHWFFKGDMIINGKKMPNSLMRLVMSTQENSNDNNVIKFCDNSSAINGYHVNIMRPKDSSTASKVLVERNRKRHITFTAETHNFPTGVAPFPGATTGTGGRIRDNHAAGRGAHVIAGTAGYCFGNLNIPEYSLPWEEDLPYPSNFATPLEIAIEASNGASDYGNKFGEPVVAGFARSFGLKDGLESRQEWIKPIMFSGGIGAIEDNHTIKQQPEKGMKVLKIGGPVYRIGVGGGAASSVQIQGDNKEALDFGAVQRGDAEMEQKLNRVIRACIELGENNPICSIHDQGAGGNGNVLKEIVEPAGAVIYTKDFEKGDPTISILELWGAEYQENDALLIKEKDCDLMKKIGKREKLPICMVGDITGDGRIVLKDCSSQGEECVGNGSELPSKRTKYKHPVDLPLDVVLGKMPAKTFTFEESSSELKPLSLPTHLTVAEALDRVLRLPSVASKRYLTNKVDRCVTGLVAQQQCVGPLHTPLADVAVVALSHFDTVGAATAIGEQPLKGLVDPACGARMSLGEALTNLVFAQITTIEDIKCSGNWMWPAKLEGEGARLYRACEALCASMKAIGVAVDGGKDSLSMAARVGDDVVKSPGAIVVSAYAPCPDITKTVTPDLKFPGKSSLLWVDIGCGKARLGGSALAHVFKQIGNTSPDLDNPEILKKAFAVTQTIISRGIVQSGHDISDGGLIVTALEMAFGGNCGLELHLKSSFSSECKNTTVINRLFSEELGLLLEVLPEHQQDILCMFNEADVPCHVIGSTNTCGESAEIVITFDDSLVFRDSMVNQRFLWESTSFRLERLQANPYCVAEEEATLRFRQQPPFELSFVPKKAVDILAGSLSESDSRPRVAVVRDEGSNGDREMVASLLMAGFNVWDVTMSDLCAGDVSLDHFRGLVFVGGFSYADVLGSAKGWAAVARFNERARKEFENFRMRQDTFSLGVCNGCQLMGLLGWVGDKATAPIDEGGNGLHTSKASEGVYFTHNTSGRFECRFVSVKVNKTPAVMLRDMENSVLGIWVAHGEGRVDFISDRLKRDISLEQLIPLQYVDDSACPTESYPFNPNGSPNGIAALCSPDGRHLAMMPHPERTTLLWQWPWMPPEWRASLNASPWLQMFHNAYTWCIDH